MRRPRKFGQKLFFWVITIMIAFGLVGGSVAMIFSPDSTQPVTPPSDEDQFGEFVRALQELEEKVKENPEDLSSRIVLGNTYGQMGQFDAAIEQYVAVLETDPEYESARLSLAESYFALERDEEALAEVERLLEANPEHQFGHFLAGYILGNGLEDYPAAVEKMERFVELAGSGPYVDEAKAMIEEWSNK
ncbi:MAG: tetratricopeptide repeat protein [Eubacteriales bacterium]|jgi:tetratricopeptide (TPR) repeat protein|nr:tetratricopeptide repeat protein [Bacillota bacterium]MBV1727552.1 tetratricopeptide repeat protein [Desulforudis sp.]MDQ7789913.1 tetratricopeptide repeat protein [Clostridia bacterium]MDZ4043894.1 tetratricopeptide repeat protein [Eubacteriales bacterium]MBU4534144.1 tetratricopeptide repeat protein [Bacillota bacterium]